ncbi:serine hydrolase domain-containing protein [Nocardiopsis sp. CC223A]|uniref:serine hydrolase domain-containing protein n=1 Tax=Nocardiopsis sp. CC223A TaxID=3044051 RepID=UPI003557F80D
MMGVRALLLRSSTGKGVGMRSRRGFLIGGGVAAAAAVVGGGAAVRWASRSPEERLADLVPEGPEVSVVAADGDPLVAVGMDTARDVCSVTKQFTAAGVMRLEMDGELSVEDPVDAFLPGAPEGVTLHRLLTHTGGLPDALGDDYEPLGREEFVAAAAAAEPVRGYLYSNVGYGLLAAVIEVVAGSYEGFLAETLFGPAGMTRTGYVLPEWDDAGVAVEYDAQGVSVGRPYERPWADDGPYWNLRGNGGMLSTARDMLAWHRALDGGAVLSERALERMFTPHVAEDTQGTSHYGYGWVILEAEGRTVAWHNGGNGAAYAEMLHVPGGPMAFWATGAVARDGEWDLEDADVAARMGEILLRM